MRFLLENDLTVSDKYCVREIGDGVMHADFAKPGRRVAFNLQGWEETDAGFMNDTAMPHKRTYTSTYREGVSL